MSIIQGHIDTKAMKTQQQMRLSKILNKNKEVQQDVKVLTGMLPRINSSKKIYAEIFQIFLASNCLEDKNGLANDQPRRKPDLSPLTKNILQDVQSYFEITGDEWPSDTIENDGLKTIMERINYRNIMAMQKILLELIHFLTYQQELIDSLTEMLAINGKTCHGS